jgi:hypothetical protein
MFVTLPTQRSIVPAILASISMAMLAWLELGDPG